MCNVITIIYSTIVNKMISNCRFLYTVPLHVYIVASSRENLSLVISNQVGAKQTYAAIEEPVPGLKCETKNEERN